MLHLEFFVALGLLFDQILLCSWHVLLLVSLPPFLHLQPYIGVVRSKLQASLPCSFLTPKELPPMWSFLRLALLAFALSSTLLVYTLLQNCVVQSAHKVKGKTFGQLLAQPLQAFSKALTITSCPLDYRLIVTTKHQISQRNHGLRQSWALLYRLLFFPHIHIYKQFFLK